MVLPQSMNNLTRKFWAFAPVLIVSMVSAQSLPGPIPQLENDKLHLTLFAEDPDIVTPVGMVVGANDEVYVIESHTHSPPSDYDGPDGDVIKVFFDRDQDGVADDHSIFAEGFDAGMNLAFSQDGVLYLICAWSLWALPDENGDGICDGPQLILELDTKATNPHGCWLGITFDDDNFMYLSRGNVGGEYYRIEGKDGSLVEGFGDGGNVVRARADGTDLEEWATGFWNAMDLKFDHKGNLLLVDNDPDARGPNRLLKIVKGGDYGHKHMFGGGGRHPFQGWDATFPGHLPFISGTGEAPSGLIDVSGQGEHSVLITIWNENTIERHDLLSDGQVEKSIFMTGGKNFRPVALDQDSLGNLYISDWVLVDYPNHGKGRIWRVSKLPLAKPVSLDPMPGPNAENIQSHLQSSDAFKRHLAEMWLSDNNQREMALDLTRNKDPRVRLGGYLALRRMHISDRPAVIRQALQDRDSDIRKLALLWASESLDLSLRPFLDNVLQVGEVSPSLFNTYLAAVEMVNDSFIHAYTNKVTTNSKRLPRDLEQGLLDKLANNPELTAEVRALAVGRLQPSEVRTFLQSSEKEVLVSAIRRSATEPAEMVRDRLVELSLDVDQSEKVRLEAVLGLSRQNVSNPEQLLPLLADKNNNIVYEAVRTLRFHIGDSSIREALARLKESTASESLAELLEMALQGLAPGGKYTDQRPKSLETWIDRLGEGGDPGRGSRVFRSRQNMCTLCHAVDGGGTNLGPDLGGIAQSVSRDQIIRSILRPSESFPPQYQAWNIYTKDGMIHSGIQIDHQARGAMLLYTTENINRRFQAEEVVNYEASPYSLMPMGLENLMTVAELNDLVAYLSSLN